MKMIRMLNCLLAGILFFVMVTPDLDAQGKKSKNSDNIIKDGKFTTVTVKGTGETLEKAKKDAIRNALVEVVGYAVREDDKFVHKVDSVELVVQYIGTVAGIISEYKELKVEQNNGIFTVTARIKVYSDKMEEGITFYSPDIKLPADPKGSPFEIQRELMTKYICSYALDYCQIWDVSTQEIIPDFDKNGSPVLYVNCYFYTTPKLYQRYLRRLRKALGHIGGEEAREYERDMNKEFYPVQFVLDPSAQGNRIADSGNMGKGTGNIWLSKKFLEDPRVVGDELEKYGYMFVCDMLDEKNEVIRTDKHYYKFFKYGGLPFPRERYGLKLTELAGKTRGSTAYSRKFYMEFKDFSSAEEMSSVKKVRITVLVVKQSRCKGARFMQYSPVRSGGWYEN